MWTAGNMQTEAAFLTPTGGVVGVGIRAGGLPRVRCGRRATRGAARACAEPAAAPVPRMGVAPEAGARSRAQGFGRQSVVDAIAAVARGEFVVVTDDESRENEGDLIAAGDKMTPEAIAFMVRHTSGVLCVAMEGEELDRLKLEPMVRDNQDPKNTAFAVTCDYRHGTTTGISAHDRAVTIAALADEKSTQDDFLRPGHIFPLRYRPGGVLKRAGHTEAAVDLSRLAGCSPVGVLCEIVNDKDGSMARLPDLIEFCKQHNLVLTSIADLVRYRRSSEKLVQRVGDAPARLPTRYGLFDAYAYRSVLDDNEHLALVLGGPFNGQEEPVLVRVHSECCTGDVFGSLRCDCGPQLDFAMKSIAKKGRGVLVYLRGQEGRGIGLAHKMRAYALQDMGRDTVQANQDLGLPVDSREYGVGAQILADLGVADMELMTNNPAKYSGLSGYGLSIKNRVRVEVSANPENEKYLRTKREKMGHWLGVPPNASDTDFANGQHIPGGDSPVGTVVPINGSDALSDLHMSGAESPVGTVAPTNGSDPLPDTKPTS